MREGGRSLHNDRLVYLQFKTQTYKREIHIGHGEGSDELRMFSGYASPSPSPSSSPPTPQSPLPVSVGPAHHHYYLSSSPSPSPPFSPHDASPTPAVSPTPFCLDRQLQPHNKLHSTCSSCLLDLLNWFFQRCCTSVLRELNAQIALCDRRSSVNVLNETALLLNKYCGI